MNGAKQDKYLKEWQIQEASAERMLPVIGSLYRDKNIVTLAREHGRVRMGEVVKLTGASRNTLKEHFRTLVERGHLNQHGAGRGVWYELR